MKHKGPISSCYLKENYNTYAIEKVEKILKLYTYNNQGLHKVTGEISTFLFKKFILFYLLNT